MPTNQNGCASAKYVIDSRRRFVAAPTYRPNAPLLVAEGRDGRMVTCINTYVPSGLILPEGEVGDDEVRPWLGHLEYLIPDPVYRNHLLGWMAFTLRYPQVKINHAPIIGGVEGVGKDSALEPVLRGVGRHNVSIVGPADVAGPWTDWAEGVKLVVIEEVKQFDRIDFTNRMKGYVAAPPDTVRVNRKNLPQYAVPNLFNVVMFTNFEHAMWLGADDRRYAVYWSPATPRPREAYAKLWAWFDAGGAEACVKWLMQHDIATFSSTAPPPATEAKRAMVEASRDPLEAYVGTFIAERRGAGCYPVVTMEELVGSLEHNAPRAIANRITETKVAAVLRGLGARRLGKARVEKGQGPRAVWALHRVEMVQRLADAGRLVDLYRRVHRTDGTHRGPV